MQRTRNPYIEILQKNPFQPRHKCLSKRQLDTEFKPNSSFSSFQIEEALPIFKSEKVGRAEVFQCGK